MGPRTWTVRRKWMGNLIPALLYLPLLVGGIFWVARSLQLLGPGLILVVAGTAVAWVAVNQFGLFENAKMKAELGTKLRPEGEQGIDYYFVGFATPKYTSLLDAHQDVGFLRLGATELRFVGESMTVSVKRIELTEVRFRANAHSWVGLGRWVSIEGTSEGKPIRLLFEPRECRTLLANRQYGRSLKTRIENWLKNETGPGH